MTADPSEGILVGIFCLFSRHTSEADYDVCGIDSKISHPGTPFLLCIHGHRESESCAISSTFSSGGAIAGTYAAAVHKMYVFVPKMISLTTARQTPPWLLTRRHQTHVRTLPSSKFHWPAKDVRAKCVFDIACLNEQSRNNDGHEGSSDGVLSDYPTVYCGIL